MNVDALIPIAALLPSWSRRRIADACRAGRIPRALKVGQTWMMRRGDYERWTGVAPALPSPEKFRIPTVEEAAEDLRRRGII